MGTRDLNYIAAVEKAIAKKYGIETIINPKALWNEEKEKEYLKHYKEHSKKERKIFEAAEKIEKGGFLISRNLISKSNKRICPICDVYSFNTQDDLYMNKFECCFECYIQWVEDREERWLKGWRPDINDKEQN